jgi:imidazolonepropionase-like amidohydrolase
MSDVLFRNASLVLDGFAGLQPSFDVLVKDRKIHSVSSQPIEPADAMVIDLAGKTLMPGLIDAHAHITGLNLSPKNISYPASEIVLTCSKYLRNSLMDALPQYAKPAVRIIQLLDC